MVVIGHKSISLISAVINDKCPNCGTAASIQMDVYQKYVHVFWIPFLPAGKTGISECNHCNQLLKHTEMKGEIFEEYQMLKKKTSTPLWMYIGLLLFVVLYIYGSKQ
jgi:phage FluMu protein Com